MVREIVTIQLGSLSNYIATHFWNTQESYFTYESEERSPVDHNVHWRQGLGADGSETFLPRTLVYDFKANFGSLRKTNQLYEVQSDGPVDSLWPGSPTIHRQPVIEQSKYQQSLDMRVEPLKLSPPTVRYWSDFSRVFFHPRSLVQLSELQLSPERAGFDDWHQGTELFKILDGEEDFLDNHIRPFVEECDLMQAFQMFASIDDAWGGFANSFLERIKDEYPKSCVWLWAPQNTPQAGLSREKRRTRLSNKARSMCDAWLHGSILVPLGFPWQKLPKEVSADPTSLWHVSALLSTGLETATLPSRLLPSSSGGLPATMDSLASSLNIQGKHTISTLQMSVGDNGVTKSNTATKSLDMDLSPVMETRTKPYANADQHVYSQTLTQRSAGRSDEELQLVHDSLFSKDENGPRPPPTDRYCSNLGFPLLDSYPPIFQDMGKANDAASISVDTLLRTDSSMSTTARLIKDSLLPFLRSDDRESLGNTLSEIHDEYHDGWSSGSDEDDD